MLLLMERNDFMHLTRRLGIILLASFLLVGCGVPTAAPASPAKLARASAPTKPSLPVATPASPSQLASAAVSSLPSPQGAIPLILIDHIYAPNAPGQANGVLVRWDPMANTLQTSGRPIFTLEGNPDPGGVMSWALFRPFVNWFWDGNNLTVVDSGSPLPQPQIINQTGFGPTLEYKRLIFPGGLPGGPCLLDSQFLSCTQGNKLILENWRIRKKLDLTYPAALIKIGYVTPALVISGPGGELKILVQYFVHDTMSGVALADLRDQAVTWSYIKVPVGFTSDVAGQPSAVLSGQQIFLSGVGSINAIDPGTKTSTSFPSLVATLDSIPNPGLNPQIGPTIIYVFGAWGKVLLVEYGGIILAVKDGQIIGYLTFDGNKGVVESTANGRTTSLSLPGMTSSYFLILPRTGS